MPIDLPAVVGEGLAGCRDGVLLAVSGGRDSTAMLHAAAGRADLVATVDHGLREGSADDAAFVAGQCGTLGVECVTLAVSPASASEDDCRAARYEALRSLAEKRGLRWVAVAHTADDQAETVLHRIARGTGVAGLSGMPRTRGLCGGVSLVRPLLTVRRADVTAWLESRGLSWREDPTNAGGDYTRGRLRNEVLPLLREAVNRRADGALTRLAASAAEYAAVVAGLAGRLLAEASRGASLECRVLRTAEPLLRREVLRLWWRRLGLPERGMSEARWRDAASVLDADGPANCDLPGGVRLSRSGGVVTARRPDGAGTR